MSVHRLTPRQSHRGKMHVRRVADEWLAVEQEGSGGSSYGRLATFSPDERDKAVRFALDSLPEYPGSVLGEVEL